MSTPEMRYEIGWMKDNDASVENAVSTKAAAVSWAVLQSCRREYTYYVFDRMARHGSICRWDFENGLIVNQVMRDK